MEYSFIIVKEALSNVNMMVRVDRIVKIEEYESTVYEGTWYRKIHFVDDTYEYVLDTMEELYSKIQGKSE